jgi:hypothetical protein
LHEHVRFIFLRIRGKQAEHPRVGAADEGKFGAAFPEFAQRNSAAAEVCTPPGWAVVERAALVARSVVKCGEQAGVVHRAGGVDGRRADRLRCGSTRVHGAARCPLGEIPAAGHSA